MWGLSDRQTLILLSQQEILDEKCRKCAEAGDQNAPQLRRQSEYAAD